MTFSTTRFCRSWKLRASSIRSMHVSGLFRLAKGWDKRLIGSQRASCLEAKGVTHDALFHSGKLPPLVLVLLGPLVYGLHHLCELRRKPSRVRTDPSCHRLSKSNPSSCTPLDRSRLGLLW